MPIVAEGLSQHRVSFAAESPVRGHKKVVLRVAINDAPLSLRPFLQESQFEATEGVVLVDGSSTLGWSFAVPSSHTDATRLHRQEGNHESLEPIR